jgi:hypothetical protein
MIFRTSTDRVGLDMDCKSPKALSVSSEGTSPFVRRFVLDDKTGAQRLSNLVLRVKGC